MTTWLTEDKLLVELGVEGIGLARTELDPRAFSEGRHFVLLDPSDDVFAASLTFTERVAPILPMTSACCCTSSRGHPWRACYGRCCARGF